MNKEWRFAVASVVFLWMTSAKASSPAEMIKSFSSQAKAESKDFRAFSAEAGNIFFHQERVHSEGTKVSCAVCHTSDPRNRGMTRANKEIAPLAPSKNPERFTDLLKVEKWFARNCRDVLERPCTAQEKGDFIEYMRSLR